MPAFKSDKIVDVRPAANGAYFTAAPGEYTAIVRKIVDKDPFMSNITGFPNPDTQDGKWPMYKITPTFELVNDRHTLIERQDLTIGVMVDGVPFSPNEKNSAVYSGWFNKSKDTRGGSLGAAGLLEAIGVMKVVDKQATFTGDTSEISDVVVRVRTGVGAYNKNKLNYGPDEFLALMMERNGGTVPPFAEYITLLNEYNEEKGARGTDDELKMKTFVLAVWGLNDGEVAAGGYFRADNGAVYLSKSSAPAAKRAPKTASTEAAPKPDKVW